MAKLILLRHGQSEWNKKNIFTGWVDIPLSAEGIRDSVAAGERLRDIPIDIIYSSTLIRAIMTALLAMSTHSSGKVVALQHEGTSTPLEGAYHCHNKITCDSLIPLYTAWQLNERLYGALQGMNKDEMRQRYGEAQIKLWRRSYSTAPPQGESLQMTAERTLPFFKEVIIEELKKGKNVLISAHGNSLRSIIMMLDKLSETEVVSLEIPMAEPLFYTFENSSFKKV